MMKADVRPGLHMLRRNMQHMKGWWEEGANEAKE